MFLVTVLFYSSFDLGTEQMASALHYTTDAVSHISKKYFRPGGMAPSEWMCSVRAVRDTPVADYYAPRLNSTCCFTYCPPIAVSPFLLALSASNLNQTVWRCAQLWPYVGMGWLGTRLHRDCNAMGDAAKISPRIPSTCAQNAILSLLIIQDCKAMGDAAKISPRVPSTCAQNAILSLLIIHIIPCRQIYVAIDNPSLVLSVSCLTTSSYLWNYVCAADDVSHAENSQSNSCQCFSHLYKFRGGIQVSRVFWYCGERQG